MSEQGDHNVKEILIGIGVMAGIASGILIGIAGYGCLEGLLYMEATSADVPKALRLCAQTGFDLIGYGTVGAIGGALMADFNRETGGVVCKQALKWGLIAGALGIGIGACEGEYSHILATQNHAHVAPAMPVPAH